MWILFTLLAALSQTFRNIFSKKLSLKVLSPVASLCRFMFGAPFALAAVAVMAASGFRCEIESLHYLIMCLGMAVFQMLANIMLVELFRYKNFAVSMTLIKTEAVILAVLGILVLNEVPAILGWCGILTATAGLVFAGKGRADKKQSLKRFLSGLISKPSLLALGAGGSLAACSVFLKISYLYISADAPVMKVMVTLAVIISIQTVLSFLLVGKENMKQIKTIFKMPVPAALTGFFAVL